MREAYTKKTRQRHAIAVASGELHAVSLERPAAWYGNSRISRSTDTGDTGTMSKTTSKLCILFMASLVGAVSFAQKSSLPDHMHDHFDAVMKIQGAVIAGSLEKTRAPARWLAEHEAPARMPDSWNAPVEAMRQAARDALDADDLASVASATSRLGIACGSCHAANDVSIEFEYVKPPPDKETAQPHMQRHEWAADRMWEGLIGPSNFTWRQGASMLFESPMKPHALGADAGDEVVLSMARRIHQLAGNATTVSEPAEKAEIYAEFLANCAACHISLDDGPRR